ncbi:MAG: hypothetical protein H6529_19310 [Nocardioides sp.]|mgnify:CR=1 FL=1|nr:hypothetical protein [Nocardioidaceae bacterium]MCB8958612.1 hypothetical protein [Nocardioides sp.]
MLNPYVAVLATEVEPGGLDTPPPYLVGAVVLLVLLALMGALLIFGAGREHS